MRDNADRATEQIHDAETRILTAFHGWASPMEQRMRGTLSFVATFEERVAGLEERMRQMEQRQQQQHQ